MRIDEAKYSDGYLMLKTSDPEARRAAYQFKPGDYELEKSKKRRSLDANSLCWSIIGKIASEMQIDRYTVYQDAIKAVGACETVILRKDALESFARVWASRGLGWVCDITGEANDYCYLNCYYGSSSYDSKQMSQLIDYLKQDAESIGINVDNDQMRTLLEDWEKEHG